MEVAHCRVGRREFLRFLGIGKDNPIPRSIKGLESQRIGVGDLADYRAFGQIVLFFLVQRPDDDGIDQDQPDETRECGLAIEPTQDAKQRGFEPKPNECGKEPSADDPDIGPAEWAIPDRLNAVARFRTGEECAQRQEEKVKPELPTDLYVERGRKSQIVTGIGIEERLNFFPGYMTFRHLIPVHVSFEEDQAENNNDEGDMPMGQEADSGEEKKENAHPHRQRQQRQEPAISKLRLVPRPIPRQLLTPIFATEVKPIELEEWIRTPASAAGIIFFNCRRHDQMVSDVDGGEDEE